MCPTYTRSSLEHLNSLHAQRGIIPEPRTPLLHLYGVELNIRDLTDHWKIHDEAWGCVTAWPHVTVQASGNPETVEEDRERRRAHFLPRCRERPNMLSMQGLERGTMVYQAALEMGVADALEIPDQDTDTSPEHISEGRS